MHAVRCCADSHVSGWAKRGGCSVWTESDLGSLGGCQHNKTHAEADCHPEKHNPETVGMHYAEEDQPYPNANREINVHNARRSSGRRMHGTHT